MTATRAKEPAVVVEYPVVFHRLDLEAAALSATASALELAALGADVGARAGVGLAGRLAEVTVRLAGRAASLHEDGVLSLGGLEGQLVEGHDLTAGLEDAFAGARRHVHRAQRKLRDFVQTKIVRHRADDDRGLTVTAWLLHHAGDSGDRHGRSVDAAHVQTLQDDLVELGFGPTGQEPVEFDQQTQVDILAFGLRPPGLPHVLVTDVDSHFDVILYIFNDHLDRNLIF